MNTTTIDKPKPTRVRKFAREPEGTPSPNNALRDQATNVAGARAQLEPKPPSKASLLLEILARSEGATLSQMVSATGWLPHTTRAALTGLRKRGFVLDRQRTDAGITTWRIVQSPDVKQAA